MPRHLWRKRSARMATGIASLFAVIMLLTLSPMSSVADNFIDQFRVRKFEAITIDFNQFQAFGLDTMFSDVQGNPDALKATLSSLGDYSTTFNQDDPWANLQQYDSVDEAQVAYGDFDVAKDVPEGYAAAPEIYASDPGSVTVNVNTAEVQALIDDIGLPIFSLPDAATNPVLTFTMDVPSGIVQHFAGPDKDSHIVVAQMPSPTLTTPASLDMNNLREDVLAIPGLPPDFVAQLRSIKDWQETLVIPVPQGVSSDDVTINGQPGLSFTEDDGSGSAVLWQDNGALHIVGGTESLDVIRDIADSLD